MAFGIDKTYGSNLANMSPKMRHMPKCMSLSTQTQLSSLSPKIYHWFERDGRTYILMKFIDCETLPQHLKNNPSERDKWDNAIVAAVEHLRSFPVHEDAKPGPLARGIPTGPFFAEYDVNRTFESQEELERWINWKLQRNGRPKRHRSKRYCRAHCHPPHQNGTHFSWTFLISLW